MNRELPDRWHWTPLAVLLTPVRSQVAPEAIHDDWVYVGLEHVQSCTGEYSGVQAGSASIKSNKFRFEPGDLLYGKLRPNLRKCAVAVEPGVSSTDLVPLRPVDPTSGHFLALQLRSEPFTAAVMRMIGGANLPRVNIKDLFSLSLPTPPPSDAARLYALARSVAGLRTLQREIALSVDEVEVAVTAAALGYPMDSASGDLRAFPDSVG